MEFEQFYATFCTHLHFKTMPIGFRQNIEELYEKVSGESIEDSREIGLLANAYEIGCGFGYDMGYLDGERNTTVRNMLA